MHINTHFVLIYTLFVFKVLSFTHIKMTSVKDKLIVLSDHDAERIKQAEKRLLQSEKKVESQTPKETTGLVIL